MRKLIPSILVLGWTIFFGLASQASATPVIDGNFGLAEWAGHYSEDNTTGQYYVDPGYGGQEYDVEYFGLQIDSGNLNFGLLTGYDIKNGRQWPAGDIALDINSNGTYDFAIDFTVNADNSVNYLLIDMQGAPIVAYGGVNGGNLAWEDVRYSAHSISNPYQAINYQGGYAFSGSYQAQLDPVYGEQSYGLEGQLSLAALGLSLGNFDSITGHWTMACGNDFLNHTESSAPVPETATMLLFGTGLAGFATAYRKKMNF